MADEDTERRKGLVDMELRLGKVEVLLEGIAKRLEAIEGDSASTDRAIEKLAGAISTLHDALSRNDQSVAVVLVKFEALVDRFDSHLDADGVRAAAQADQTKEIIALLRMVEGSKIAISILGGAAALAAGLISIMEWAVPWVKEHVRW